MASGPTAGHANNSASEAGDTVNPSRRRDARPRPGQGCSTTWRSIGANRPNVQTSARDADEAGHVIPPHTSNTRQKRLELRQHWHDMAGAPPFCRWCLRRSPCESAEEHAALAQKHDETKRRNEEKEAARQRVPCQPNRVSSSLICGSLIARRIAGSRRQRHARISNGCWAALRAGWTC